jgi:selenium metabolism protein YedF
VALEPKIIDLRGLKCPEPQKKTQEELEAIRTGVLIILADSPANWNIQRYAKKQGMKVESSKHKDHYELKITKDLYSKPKKGILKRIMRALRQEESVVEKAMPEDKSVLLIISTDALGKEEALGKMLMKGFFETMKVTGELPHTMFFLNAGVRLTTVASEIIPTLKDIASKGVEVYSCGTCLKHYGLEDSLKVGYRGTTNHIVEGIKDFNKTVWI